MEWTEQDQTRLLLDAAGLHWRSIERACDAAAAAAADAVCAEGPVAASTASLRGLQIATPELLTEQDDAAACTLLEKRLYRSFRASFGTAELSDASVLLDVAGGGVSWGWEAFAMPWTGQIDGLHDAALVRRSSCGGYEEDNVVVATRLHFFCVELARREEGLYDRDLPGAVALGRFHAASTALTAATAANDAVMVQQIARTLLTARAPPTRQQLQLSRVGRALGRAVQQLADRSVACAAQLLLRQWRSALVLTEHPDGAVSTAAADLIACHWHAAQDSGCGLEAADGIGGEALPPAAEFAVAGLFGESAAAGSPGGSGGGDGGATQGAQQLRLEAVLRRLGLAVPPAQGGSDAHADAGHRATDWRLSPVSVAYQQELAMVCLRAGLDPTVAAILADPNGSDWRHRWSFDGRAHAPWPPRCKSVC